MKIINIFILLIACFIFTDIVRAQPANVIKNKKFTENEIKNMADTRVVIETRLGKIELKFYPESVPNHVNAFIKLIKEDFYDGTIFHNIKSDMIEGGNPNYKKLPPRTSHGTVKFSRESEASVDYRIPEGFRLLFNNRIYYMTTKEVILKRGQISVIAPVKSMTAGSHTNISDVGIKLIDINPTYGYSAVRTASQITGASDWSSYTFKPESEGQKHRRGTLSISNVTYPDGLGYEFYICTSDSKYSCNSCMIEESIVIGEVTSGMDVIETMQNIKPHASKYFHTTYRTPCGNSFTYSPKNRIEMSISISEK